MKFMFPFVIVLLIAIVVQKSLTPARTKGRSPLATELDRINQKANPPLTKPYQKLKLDVEERSTTKSQNDNAIAVFKKSITVYKSSRNDVNRDVLLDKAISSLQQAYPLENGQLAAKILADPYFSLKELGKDQAFGRMLAIEILRRSMKAGKYTNATQAISGIARLHENDSGLPGVDLDLEQLVHFYVKSNPERFASNAGEILEELGYNRANDMIFTDAIAMALKKKPGLYKDVAQYFYQN